MLYLLFEILIIFIFCEGTEVTTIPYLQDFQTFVKINAGSCMKATFLELILFCDMHKQTCCLHSIYPNLLSVSVRQLPRCTLTK